MNAWDPRPPHDDSAPRDGSAPARPREAAFEVARASAEGAPPPTPVVFASPHSGALYPPEMLAAARLPQAALRGSEDAFVDRLIAGAPRRGVATIRARLARAYFDLNREPWELDPAMFEGELPDFAQGRTARVAAGLGAIAKMADGRPIYARKLTFDEARDRVERAHRPYHDTLDRLLAQARNAHGLAVLIDWHSMPAAATQGARGRVGGPCDIVLGDRFGAACAPGLTRMVEAALEDMGYRVARNSPYAGGYTTEHYGRPARRTHALQVEINRALYMNEETREPTDGLAVLTAHVDQLTALLAAADWTTLA